MNIQFDSIEIYNVSGNSGVFTGSNIQVNWQSHHKANNAQGTVIGNHNLMIRNINVVYDNDLIDMPIIKSEGSKSNRSKKGDRD